MKAKKYLMIVAIFGGLLFTAEATNLLDGNATVKIDKKKRKIPANG